MIDYITKKEVCPFCHDHPPGTLLSGETSIMHMNGEFTEVMSYYECPDCGFKWETEEQYNDIMKRIHEKWNAMYYTPKE
jgi:rubredoxin